MDPASPETTPPPSPEPVDPTGVGVTPARPLDDARVLDGPRIAVDQAQPSGADVRSSAADAPLIVILGATGRVGRRVVAMVAPLVAAGRVRIRAAVRSAAVREASTLRLDAACALTLEDPPAAGSTDGLTAPKRMLPDGFEVVVANARDGAALRDAYRGAVAIVDLTAEAGDHTAAIHADIARTAAEVGAHYITPALAWPAEIPELQPNPASTAPVTPTDAGAATPTPTQTQTALQTQSPSLGDLFAKRGLHAVVAAGAYPGVGAWLARHLVAAVGADASIDRVRAAWFEESVPGWSHAAATAFARAVRTRIQPTHANGSNSAHERVRLDFGGVVGVEPVWPIASIDRGSIASDAPGASIELYRAGDPAALAAQSVARSGAGAKSQPADDAVGRKLAMRFGRRQGVLATVLGTALRTGGMLIVEARERAPEPRFASLRLAVEDTGALTAIGVWLALRSLIVAARPIGEQAGATAMSNAGVAMVKRWDIAAATANRPLPKPGLSALSSWPIPRDLTAAIELVHGHDLEIDLPAVHAAGQTA